MNRAANVGFSVVNDPMGILARQSLVGEKGVCVQFGPRQIHEIDLHKPETLV